MADDDEKTPLLGKSKDVDTDETVEHERQSRKGKIVKYFTSNQFLMYVCCFITSWGDRMWMFAIGVYMIALYPTSLQLTAIYGFVNSASSLVFGAIIGDMIDQSQRLSAVRVALSVRNLSIFLCSASIFVTFTFLEDINGTIWSDVSKGLIIFLAVLAHLASMANQITVTKDWAVVVCGTNKEKLAEMSAFFRRIDLVCKIISPIVVGQIMSYVSNSASAIFICGENLVTLFIMYGILRAIYHRTPRLAIKEDSPGTKRKTTTNTSSKNDGAFSTYAGRLCFSCISFGKGWSCFIRQSIAPAGISLAMMYMTVLGFDNITVGYAYSQGMSPSVLSWFMAGAAITGIIGTMLFQPLRRRIGLVKTGVLAFILDLLLLQMCVWSIFAPGTAFLKWAHDNQTHITSENYSDSLTLSTNSPSDRSESFSLSSNTSSHSSPIADFFNNVNLSLLLLMTGIVATRTGLWLVDLVVTQLTLETVSEKNRGKVNGVQFSLNMFLDLVKFLLVILIPDPPYFGYLIIASFASVVLGFLIFLVYSCCRRCRDPPSVDDLSATNQRETTCLLEDEESCEKKTVK